MGTERDSEVGSPHRADRRIRPEGASPRSSRARWPRRPRRTTVRRRRWCMPRSITQGAAAFADERVREFKTLGPQSYIVSLPPREGFTETVRQLQSKGVRFLSIAGNDDILLTALAPNALVDAVPIRPPRRRTAAPDQSVPLAPRVARPHHRARRGSRLADGARRINRSDTRLLTAADRGRSGDRCLDGVAPASQITPPAFQ